MAVRLQCAFRQKVARRILRNKQVSKAKFEIKNLVIRSLISRETAEVLKRVS